MFLLAAQVQVNILAKSMLEHLFWNICRGGSFKCFYFHPYKVEMIQFD